VAFSSPSSPGLPLWSAVRVPPPSTLPTAPSPRGSAACSERAFAPPPPPPPTDDGVGAADAVNDDGASAPDRAARWGASTTARQVTGVSPGGGDGGGGGGGRWAAAFGGGGDATDRDGPGVLGGAGVGRPPGPPVSRAVGAPLREDLDWREGMTSAQPPVVIPYVGKSLFQIIITEYLPSLCCTSAIVAQRTGLDEKRMAVIL